MKDQFLLTTMVRKIFPQGIRVSSEKKAEAAAHLYMEGLSLSVIARKIFWCLERSCQTSGS
jgi:hypothetical protein